MNKSIQTAEAEKLAAAFAAFQAGRLDEAERLCKLVLVRHPKNFDALHLRGVIAGQVGQRQIGIRLLKEAVRLRPQAADAKNHLANLLKQEGKIGEAAALYEEATRLQPDYAAAHNNLGLLHLGEGRGKDAIACFRRAVAIHPGFANAHYNLAVALVEQERLVEAVQSYRQAIEHSPELAEAHHGLGEVLRFKGELAEAARAYLRAAAVDPDSRLGRLSAAKALWVEHRLAEAESSLRRAIERDPGDLDAHQLLGDMLKEAGRFDEAVACFEQGLTRQPSWTKGWIGITSSKKFTVGDRPLIDRMIVALRSPGLSWVDRSNLQFALGKAFDDLGDYAKAVSHYDEANRLCRSLAPFDRNRLAAKVDRLIAGYGPDFLARAADMGSTSDLPILVLGMMRSGTTLIEQILSSHPEVGAGDELPFWGERATELGDDGAENLDASAAAKTIQDYIGLLQGIAPSARHVTDKMPHNFFAIGLIHGLFPNARIIHCRRNPADICLSIYFNQFSMANNFTSERGDIVFYYRQYERLMAHWRSLVPRDRMLEIDYETLVADREAVSRRLIEFCDLDWSESCLAPERNSRTVRTASVWQARQPVYTSSVERWRRYEPWLGELRELLDGVS